MPLPILLFDESKRAVDVNDAAVAFLDAETKADLKDRPFTDRLHPEDGERSERRFERLMGEEIAVPEVEYRVETVEGTVKRATVATAPGTYRGKPVAQAIVRHESSEWGGRAGFGGSLASTSATPIATWSGPDGRFVS